MASSSGVRGTFVLHARSSTPHLSVNSRSVGTLFKSLSRKASSAGAPEDGLKEGAFVAGRACPVVGARSFDEQARRHPRLTE
jgi:hypothetical protein